MGEVPFDRHFGSLMCLTEISKNKLNGSSSARGGGNSKAYIMFPSLSMNLTNTSVFRFTVTRFMGNVSLGAWIE